MTIGLSEANFGFPNKLVVSGITVSSVRSIEGYMCLHQIWDINRYHINCANKAVDVSPPMMFHPMPRLPRLPRPFPSQRSPGPTMRASTSREHRALRSQAHWDTSVASAPGAPGGCGGCFRGMAASLGRWEYIQISDWPWSSLSNYSSGSKNINPSQTSHLGSIE